ncbi:MAG: GNAT family N-acetyltransferase [Myxococcales bacterium]
MPGKTHPAAKPVGRLHRKKVRAATVRPAATVDSAVRAAVRPGVRIRTADPDDRDVLIALRRQAEQVHARLLPDYFRVSPDRELELRVASVDDAATVTLVAQAVADETVLGYLTVKIVDTPRDPAMTPRRRAHVETVVVDERHRGGGIGTALMRAAADWARRRQATELVLTVWSDNAAAEALYRRLGYQPIARVLRQPLDPP